ncbi:MAG TPA: EAL domain-containing protein [Thermoleophilaceae bacterium]|nr:EAL domain-containing protein [Thermoleophilaceae bacterium]
MQPPESPRELAPGGAGSAELRYRLLVEQIPAITYIADFKGDRPFLYVSPQAEDLLGYPASEWVEDPMLWERILHPDDRERVLSEEQRTLAAEEEFESEYRLVSREGRVLWFWERDMIVRDDYGTPVCTQGVLVDVTDVKRAQAQIRDERDRAQRYLDIAATMIVVIAADGRVSLVNRRACEVLGYSEEELLGQDWFELVVPDADRESTRSVFKRLTAADGDRSEEFEHRVVSKTGDERLIAWRNKALRDERDRVTGILSSGEDITERRKAQERVAYLAYHDQLTALPNRAMLQDNLTVAVARASRSGMAVGLLCLDLDDFKLVNDSLGHAVGDELLLAVAKRLDSSKRHGDVLARAGGDEFFVLLPDLPEEGEGPALAAAQRVVAAFQDPFEVAGTELHVSTSVGVSLFPRDAGDADELLRHADAAMYQAKRNARAGFAVYSQEADDPFERLSLTSRLRRSLKQGELVLHYQPIFSLPDRTPVALEALIRWDDPDRGLLLPEAFIPAAEHSGLIEPIGEWVLNEVCAQAARWATLGLRPRLSVNASPRELRRPEYSDTLAAALRRHGIEPSQLVVEVTESAAMEEASAARRLLGRLDTLGVGLAIDDFGEGFSSLSRLRELPVDQLKIDRSFMRDVPGSEGASAVITAIIRLAEALGRTVVAEGVETEEQHRFLVEQGCPLAQGFHLCRPLPADDVTALLLRN